MHAYMSAVWRCRYFWLSLVKNDLRTRYRRSLLGIGWSLLHPLAMTAVITLVFTTMFGKGDWREYAPQILAALACWNFIKTVTLQGCQCLFQGEPYIRQYPAPLAIYPLRTALCETFHFVVALALAVVLSWFLRPSADLRMIWLLVPNVLLLFFLGWSLAVLAGFANVHFHDTQHLGEIFFQILFYATPIMWPDELVNDLPLGRILYLNPVRAFLRLIRDPILEGKASSPTVYAVAVVSTCLAMLAASAVLVRLQRRLIFHL
jgi:lipopolysaccharide transport system permease protein